MYNLNDLDMIFRKYEFSSEAQAQQIIDALGEEHNNSIVYLPSISSKYHIDVLWSDTEPIEWQSYQVWCPPVGVHIFGNSAAVQEWTERCKEIHPEYFPEPEIEL